MLTSSRWSPTRSVHKKRTEQRYVMEKTFNFVRLVVIYLLFEVPDAYDLSGRVTLCLAYSW